MLDWISSFLSARKICRTCNICDKIKWMKYNCWYLTIIDNKSQWLYIVALVIQTRFVYCMCLCVFLLIVSLYCSLYVYLCVLSFVINMCLSLKTLSMYWVYITHQVITCFYQWHRCTALFLFHLDLLHVSFGISVIFSTIKVRSSCFPQFVAFGLVLHHLIRCFL